MYKLIHLFWYIMLLTYCFNLSF